MSPPLTRIVSNVFHDMAEDSAHVPKQGLIIQVLAKLHTALVSTTESFAAFLLDDACKRQLLLNTLVICNTWCQQWYVLTIICLNITGCISLDRYQHFVETSSSVRDEESHMSKCMMSHLRKPYCQISYTNIKSHQYITVPLEYAHFKLNLYFQINSQLFVRTQLRKALTRLRP